jgi:cysteine-rich repeat protein
LTVDKKCETVCGDGIFMPSFENCDDGNNNDGDGCSSTCFLEYDWSCSNR